MAETEPIRLLIAALGGEPPRERAGQQNRIEQPVGSGANAVQGDGSAAPATPPGNASW